jgi:hypothetical protein
VEGPARRFEACCQLTLADAVGVADDPGSVALYKWLMNNRHEVARQLN